MSTRPDDLDINDESKYGFHDPEVAVYQAEQGLSEQLIRDISAMKDERDQGVANDAFSSTIT